MNTVGFIFARGGSKGVPRKNIRPLAGKPLIAYSIETALASTLIHRVVVSTDDPEIAAVARQYGADVPFLRPAELAQDRSPEWLAWRHAIQSINEAGFPVDVFVALPPTSPLRSVEDVDRCIQTLLDGDVDIVITAREAARNPYYNMIVVDQAGYANLVIPPTGDVHRRQDAPAVYDITTVAYAARPEFVLSASSIFAGKVKALLVPTERALDIDTVLDLEFAEFMIKRSRTEK